jgi:hypothetical protein
MNYYHIWCDLLDTHKAHEFCQAVNDYLGYLKERKLVEGHKVTRRKLGFGPPELGEFHIIIETKDLVQLEANFQSVAKPDEKTARLHGNVYSRVKNFRSGLYRDYPDVF